MSDLKRYSGEYRMLSYLVIFAGRARDVLRRALVTEAAFTDEKCRAAFAALMRSQETTSPPLLGLARSMLPAIANKAEAEKFLRLSGDYISLVRDATAFSIAAVLRENAESVKAMLSLGSPADPELLLEGQIKSATAARSKIDAIRASISDAPRNSGDARSRTATDESLLHMPGFIDELVAYSMRTAQRPNRALSFAGALALLAHLAARKFVGPNESRPNIYIIALADSGVGKDWPRSLNRRIALQENIQTSVQNDISSGQGLEDALLRTPALLMQMDEFDTVLNVMKDDKGNKLATEAMWKVLLSMFSSSGSTYTTRLKAVTAKGGGGGDVIYNPSLSIMATAVPSKFYAALCERALDNGFLARCLVLEAGARGEYNPESGIGRNELPASVARGLRHIALLGRRFAGNVEIDPRDLTDVPFAEGAADEVKAVNEEADALYDKASRDGDGMGMSVWNRSLELVQKIALLYAISEGLGTQNGFAVTRDAVAWAWRFVKSLQQRMLQMASENTAANATDEKVMRALRLVRKAGKKGISRSALSKRTHFSAKEIDEIESTLLDRGEISVRALPASANGKPAKLYIAVNGK